MQDVLGRSGSTGINGSKASFGLGAQKESQMCWDQRPLLTPQPCAFPFSAWVANEECFSKMPCWSTGPAAHSSGLCSSSPSSRRAAVWQRKAPAAMHWAHAVCRHAPGYESSPTPPTTIPTRLGAKETSICCDLCIRQSSKLRLLQDLWLPTSSALPPPLRSSVNARKEHA